MPKSLSLIRIVCSLLIVAASSATLLLVAHPGVVGCPGSAVSGIIDCRAVVTSEGGRVLGLPLGFWGLVWLALFWLERIISHGRWGPVLAALGVIGVAYAVGTEIGVGHICAWCSLDQASILALAAATVFRPSTPGVS